MMWHTLQGDEFPYETEGCKVSEDRHTTMLIIDWQGKILRELWKLFDS